jgi:hypothetical protein
MIKIHFETPCFGSLNFPHLPPPRMILPRVHDFSMGVLPQINDCESLYLFGLQKFQTFLLALSPRVLSPEVNDPSTCVFWNQWLICTSGLREFWTQRNLSHPSPLECPVFGLHDLSPRGEILEVGHVAQSGG